MGQKIDTRARLPIGKCPACRIGEAVLVKSGRYVLSSVLLGLQQKAMSAIGSVESFLTSGRRVLVVFVSLPFSIALTVPK